METEIKKQYAAILKAEKTMLKYLGKDEYFKHQQTLKDLLVQFLRTEFTTLPKEKFLKVCDLVSSHRPVAPFSFLVSISMRKSK